MGLPIRRPKIIHTVWLHVDRLDREDGRVWAVQWCDGRGRQHYQAVTHVATFQEGRTISWARSESKRQPRAVVSFVNAKVKIERHGDVWTAAIAAAPDRVLFAATSRGIEPKRQRRV